MSEKTDKAAKAAKAVKAAKDAKVVGAVKAAGAEKAAGAGRLPKRDEIEEKYKWKLEDIYETDDMWEEDFKRVKQLASGVSIFKGALAQSAEKLLECFIYCEELFCLSDKLFLYARMRRDEDNSNRIYQALADRAMALGTEVYAAASFIVPEIMSIDEAVLRGFIEGNEHLKVYKQYISELLRQKKHILSEREEEILALASEVMHAPSDIFGMFNNADIKFPFVKDENGADVELTKGRYIKFLESRDRKVREGAFKAMYETYGKAKNTLAATLGNSIKKDKFHATIRRYGSCLEAALDGDNIDTTVYTNLIDIVNKNLPLLHKYLRLRKKALKLDTLHMYDLYVPLVEEPEKNIPYEEAVKQVEAAFEPLGENYCKVVRHAFESRWVDVCENEGKTSGAYSWGAYRTHPYVLLNYQGMINDVFTIAHEMGHAMHSYLTTARQPYIYSEYRIFVAEVASTVNESLLMHHMLGRTSDTKVRAYLLNHYLEEFRGTVIRQVMFSEFEKITHEKAESGVPLTAAELSGIYRQLNERYFGDVLAVDDEIDMEWARIPHFYRSFYVYKYATGFSVAMSLSRQILDEGKPAVDRYIEFLSSGSSDYPLNLLKKAGVDLSTPKPVEDAFKLFSQLTDELDSLLTSKK